MALRASQSLDHPKSQDLYLWAWRTRSMLWDRCFIKEYIRKEGPGLKLEISGPFPTKEKDGNLKLPMQVYIEYPYI